MYTWVHVRIGCGSMQIVHFSFYIRAGGSSGTLVGLIINYSLIYVLYPHQVHVMNTFVRCKVCAFYTGSYIRRAANVH